MAHGDVLKPAVAVAGELAELGLDVLDARQLLGAALMLDARQLVPCQLLGAPEEL